MYNLSTFIPSKAQSASSVQQNSVHTG